MLNLSKPQFEEKYYSKIIKNLKVYTKNKQECRLDVQPDIACDNFVINLTDMQGKLLAKDNITIDWSHKLLKERDISVVEEKRRGYGAVIKLATVIEVIENNLNKIDLFALREAIPFHRANGFSPKIESLKDIDVLLHNISKNNLSEFSTCKKEAIDILDDIRMGMGLNSFKELRDRINLLVKKYVDISLNNKINWNAHANIHADIDMVLTKEEIMRSKDTYNAAFANHGIDYRI